MFCERCGKILKSIIFIVLLSMLSVTLLAGCGKADSDSDTTQPTEEQLTEDASKSYEEQAAADRKAKAEAVEVFTKYLTACFEHDGLTEYELTINPYELESRLKMPEYNDEQDLINSYVSGAVQLANTIEKHYGENVSQDIKITNVTRYSKDDIKIFNKYIQCGQYYDENIIQDICLVEAEITDVRSKATEEYTLDYVIWKIKGKWYKSEFPGLWNKASVEEALASYKD